MRTSSRSALANASLNSASHLGRCKAQNGQIYHKWFLQAEMAVVKRIPLGEKVEKVVVEQAVTVSGGIDKSLPEGKSIFQTSPYLTMAQTSTWQLSLAALTFSCPGLVQSLPIFQNQCSFLLRKNIRNIKLQSLSQISKHESIALVIRSYTHHNMPNHVTLCPLGSPSSEVWQWLNCEETPASRSLWFEKFSHSVRNRSVQQTSSSCNPR